jgi:DNA adenine methylase
MHKIRSPLAGWLGGKYQLASRIISRIPEHQCYVEPFAGAGWVFYNKPSSQVEVINDINKEIVTLYRVVQHHLGEFIQHFKWLLISREEYLRRWEESPETMTDIQRAVRFYYLHQNSFGGKIAGASFGTATTRPPKLNLLRIEEALSEAHLRLSRAYIENLPYADLIRRYDREHTFFYIDPPYWNCEDDYGKGIFNKEDFRLLVLLISQLKGKALMSINDTPEIRELFCDFKIEEVAVRYSIGSNSRPKAMELLISNY